MFGPPSAGTIGGPWEEGGGPSQTPPPFRPPLPPLLIVQDLKRQMRPPPF